PVVGDAAGGVAVPAGAEVPGGVLQTFLQPVVPALFRFRAGGQPAAGVVAEVFDGLADVAGLGFEHVDDGARADVGVGAVHQEQVREFRHRDAEVGAGAFAGPGVGEFAAV